MTPNIFFWKADNTGCGYYRMHLPAKYLNSQGHAYTQANTRLDVDQAYQVIVAQRTTGRLQSELFREIAKSRTLAVYEMDDDLFNIPEHNPAHSYYADPEVRSQLEGNLAAADLITVSTEYLGERVKEYSDAPVEVLPNCLDLGSFSKRPESTRGLSVGWAGSGTHRGDLEAVGEAIRKGVDKAGARFVTVGADYSWIIEAKESEYLGWANEVDQFHHLINFDIGLAPIENNEFNRSKSCLKALEYGARGIPVIASNVEPYAKYVEHGVDGFLVNHEHEWTKYIRLLANDKELRQSMGNAAYQKAQQFGIEKRAHLWTEAYSRHMGV